MIFRRFSFFPLSRDSYPLDRPLILWIRYRTPQTSGLFGPFESLPTNPPFWSSLPPLLLTNDSISICPIFSQTKPSETGTGFRTLQFSSIFCHAHFSNISFLVTRRGFASRLNASHLWEWRLDFQPTIPRRPFFPFPKFSPVLEVSDVHYFDSQCQEIPSSPGSTEVCVPVGVFPDLTQRCTVILNDDFTQGQDEHSTKLRFVLRNNKTILWAIDVEGDALFTTKQPPDRDRAIAIVRTLRRVFVGTDTLALWPVGEVPRFTFVRYDIEIGGATFANGSRWPDETGEANADGPVKFGSWEEFLDWLPEVEIAADEDEIRNLTFGKFAVFWIAGVGGKPFMRRLADELEGLPMFAFVAEENEGLGNQIGLESDGLDRVARAACEWAGMFSSGKLCPWKVGAIRDERGRCEDLGAVQRLVEALNEPARDWIHERYRSVADFKENRWFAKALATAIAATIAKIYGDGEWKGLTLVPEEFQSLWKQDEGRLPSVRG